MSLCPYVAMSPCPSVPHALVPEGALCYQSPPQLADAGACVLIAAPIAQPSLRDLFAEAIQAGRESGWQWRAVVAYVRQAL